MNKIISERPTSFPPNLRARLADLRTKPKILIGICTPLAMLLILGAVSVSTTMSVVDNNKWVDHTNRVLGKAAAIVGSAVDMETGMRGYLLAGKEDFLAPYTAGGKKAFEDIAGLKDTVSDNPKQVARLGEAEKTLKEWQSQIADTTTEMRRQIGDAKTMNDMAGLVGEARGKQYFDKFRGQIATFIGREQVLLDKRRADFKAAFDQLSAGGAGDSNLIRRMGDNERWVTHTYKVIGEANAILAAAVDMETGMRGYLLAGKEDFLEPYKGGKVKFASLIGKLRQTVSDNPQQVQLLTETEQNISDWVKNVTEPTIALRRQIGDAKTMDDMARLIGEARGKQYFDKFRQLMADFAAEEQGLLVTRRANSAEAVSFTYSAVAICLTLGLLVGLALAWLIGNGIANPIGQMTAVMGRLAKGDKTIEVTNTDRKDEIGAMAVAVQVFKDSMIENDRLQSEQAAADKQALDQEREREAQTAAAEREEIERRETEAAERQKRVDRIEKLIANFEQAVSTTLDAVASTASQTQSSAKSMSSTADATSQQSSAVAAASEEATSNVQTVAGATEELSASIQEISRQVTNSNEISQKAIAEATLTNEKVEGLAEAAQKIGDVVSLINDIASQTNLLALNATIEAARAGDAGKGFAVVATEVKSLADQTARATEEIGEQVGAIQGATEDAVTAIQGIGATIKEVGEISTAVAAAVEEQGSATREIASNVQQAAAGNQEVSSNIGLVTQAADESKVASSEMLAAASHLVDQGEALRAEIDTFLGEVRAA